MDSLEKRRNYYVKDFLNYLTVERNLAPRTIKEYQLDLKLFFDFYKPHLEGELSLEGFDERTLREYLSYLKLDKNYTPRAMNRTLSTLKAYFAFLEKEEYIKKNFMASVKGAKLGKYLPKVLTESEVAKILEAPLIYNVYKNTGKEYLAYRDKAILELIYATGIRISELVKIKFQDIDFENNIIKVRGKGDKDRLVIFNESAKDAIKVYLEKIKDKTSSLIFEGKKNTPLSNRMIEYLFEKYLKLSGVTKEASPHTFRHSFATHLLQHGADLVSIKELLGHENLSTTQIYTNISMQHIKNVYDKTHPRK